MNSRDLLGSPYGITTCTLNAGWGSSALMSSSVETDRVYSGMADTPSSWPSKVLPSELHGYVFLAVPNFANLSNFLLM